MKGQAHLLILPEPLIHEGEDYEVLCSKKVLSAWLAFLWVDELLTGQPPESTLRVCSKCWNLALEQMAKKREQMVYVYGLINGSEVRQKEIA